jgi:acyl transferase domain-containing protein
VSRLSFPGETPSAEEPIAVIGVSCRLPQADGPGPFWRLLQEGVDAVADAPEDRWPRQGGPAEYRRGGFIEDVDRFDAGFFGISPNEASAMDPQQRLTLELAWEALEDARIVPGSLRGAAAGVFVGAIAGDYASLHDRLGPEALGPHAFTGVQRGIIANRVSYLLGLRGPSLTVDAGQSSSLLAVQSACEDLRRGDSRLALAGGVNLNLLPETSETIGRFGALSPDGRCYTFDSRANGYVRGEGGALVVLKPLSTALADGDTVHCVILGGAVNNDGGGDGLTVPSARAQQEVIELACRRAGVRPAQVQYVEAHGTGTSVGDPIEAAALGAALGTAPGRAAALLVGSVKTNIGHLEGAAGIAGLLKVVLSIKHRSLAPNLNFVAPSPRIPLADLGLEMVRGLQDWPQPQERLVAGVSSFGIGGTNCHLVLAEAPGAQSAEAQLAGRTEPPACDAPWVLSARSAPGLRAQALKLSGHLARNPAIEPADVALSLADTRARFEHRAVLLGTDRDRLLAGLDALAADQADETVVTGASARGGQAFVFPGQGSQWPQMARELLGSSRIFADSLEHCAQELAPYLDYSLLDVLRGTPGAADLGRVEVVQPALWAMMVSLADLWRAHGVEPGLVIGHSQGEIAAATVIGALSVADAARVVALRSQAVAAMTRSGLLSMALRSRPTAGPSGRGLLSMSLRSRAAAGRSGGGMLSIGAPAGLVEQRLADWPQLSLAAVNGPNSVVVSGSVDTLTDLQRTFDAEGHRTKILPVTYASHSAAVDELREQLLAALAPIRPVSTSTPFISTLTGEPMDTAGLDAEYWFRSLRHPVRFAAATARALAGGCGLFIECSPHPVLVGSIEESAEAAEQDAVTVGTLRRGDGGPDRFRRSLAEAFAGGADVDWSGYCARPGARPIDLPTYAFQRERYWLTDTMPQRPAAARAAALGPQPEPAAIQPEPAGAPSAATTARSRRAVRELVLTTIAGVLGHRDERAVDPALTFKDLGFDSAGTVELRSRLRSATGLRLATTLLFDFPTPNRLADHLHTLLREEQTDLAVPATTAVTTPATGADQDADPIVIVGMGCRYPGSVTSPDELWQLVSCGTDAISALPTNRGWDFDALFGTGPDRPGICATRYGGFLHDADEFDAAFFGLSPREALSMDPQQRLLLETSWEAFERAGIDPADLVGSATGVFVGAMTTDYGPRLHRPTGIADGNLLTGIALSVVSGRVAYTFGLQGPAISIDTACSSSLVAIHLAVQALRRGECSLALAGGVTLMANPGNLVEFSRHNGLAGDGRAKVFAAGADGTVFAEGAGMLLLERLSDARRNGRPVLAVVRGAAVNQDGASNGLTAPNGQAQCQVIRLALADAGLRPQDVDAVEAHGTGTQLGDPIEANAILATYGQGRDPQQYVWLGSLKSNIGHTQAAAGVAGVIKMVMAMRHGELPRTLHVDEPTPKADWDSGQVRLLTEAQPWPQAGRPARAAVSSFGISGTNAHLILEAAPITPTAEEPEAAQSGDARGPLVWVLSARTESSLRARAGLLCTYAADAADRDLAAAGPTLARRPAFAHRAVVVAAGRAELCAALADLAAGRQNPALVTGPAAEGTQPVFVFPGQGSQWVGMAAELLETEPTFAAQMRLCDEALAPHTGWSAVAVLSGADGAPALDGSQIIQPVLFAVMVSLAAIWRAAGVEPAAVIGHSQGEIAAAYVAGALGLADAAKLVATRSQVLAAIDGTGGMLSAALPIEQVCEKIAPWPGALWVALHNGPASTVIGGDLAAIEQFTEEWGASVQLRRTALDYAAHTPHIEAVREDLLARIGVLTPMDTEIAICSSYTGDFIQGTELGPEHWYRSLAEQVRFDTAIRAFAPYPKPLFIECSPHPILAGDVRDILGDAGIQGAAVGTLRRDHGDRRQFALAAAKAYVLGAPVAWPELVGPVRRHVDLPTYAFDRRRYWLEGEEPAAAGTHAHPLLDSAVATAHDGGFLLAGRLSRTAAPWLTDHTVGAGVLLPGTAFVELALQAATMAGADRIDELMIEAPLALPDTGAVQVQIAVGGADAGGRRTVSVHSQAAAESGWTRHATGVLAADAVPAAPPAEDLTQWPPTGATRIDLADAYERLADTGYEYGPAFQGLDAAWRIGDDLYAQVRLPEPVDADAGAFALHPALLDAALHLLMLEEAAREERSGMLLPFSWSGVQVTGGGVDTLRVHLSGSAAGGAHLALYDGAGHAVGTVGELIFRPVPQGALVGSGSVDPGLYDLDWVATILPAAQPGGRQWAVLGSDPRAEEVCAELKAAGIGASLHGELASVADQAAGPIPPIVVLPYLPDPDLERTDPPHAVREGLRAILGVVQQWLDDERFDDSRLVVLADHRSLASAPVWGVVRSAQSEDPGVFTLADLGTESADSWLLLAAALDADEPQCAVRDGRILLPRVVRRRSAPGRPADLSTGTVLVTGGTGALGGLVAARLAERHGARDLLLVSRRGADAAGGADLAERLGAFGASVRIESCDVSDRSALTRLLASIPPDRPLIGVVHAAGILDDSMMAGLSPERLDTVLRPKADAAWLLHELTADLPLRAFVLFSSIAGVLGTAGQGNYAAANTFLDALAAHRRSLGLPAASVAWGVWSADGAGSGGMAAGLSAADHARLARAGATPLTAAQGLDLFDAALSEGEAGDPLVLASRWNLAGLRAQAEIGARLPAVLRGLVRAPRRPAQPGSSQPGSSQPGSSQPGPSRPGSAQARSSQPRSSRPGSAQARVVPTKGTGPAPAGAAALAQRLVGLDPAEVRRVLVDLVRAEVAAVLLHGSAQEVEVDRPFADLGMDSLASVELRDRLGDETGLRLPQTLVFSQPTVDGVAEYLVGELAPAAPAADQVLLEALDRVAALLEQADADPAEHNRVAAVLQAAAARFDGRSGAQEPPRPALDAASDEELFRFIDTKL